MKKLYIYYFILVGLILVSILHVFLGRDFKEGFSDGYEAANNLENGIYWSGNFIEINRINDALNTSDTLVINNDFCITSRRNTAIINLKNKAIYSKIKYYDLSVNLLSIPLIVLTFWLFCLLFNLFRRIKKTLNMGNAFSLEVSKSLFLLGLILVALYVTYLSMRYLESIAAEIVLTGTNYVIRENIDVEYIYLIFGFALMFVAEYMKIGYKLQEEQNLTI